MDTKSIYTELVILISLKQYSFAYLCDCFSECFHVNQMSYTCKKFSKIPVRDAVRQYEKGNNKAQV